MRNLMICFAALVLVLSLSAVADETKKPEATPSMEGMPEMGATAEVKKLAAEMVGDWDVVMKMRMSPTDENWMESKGTCKWETILDGSVLQQTYDSPMMGMSFKGIGWLAYNRQTKAWVNSWADNMSGSISFYQGRMDGDKMIFEAKEPMMGKEYFIRMTTTTVKPGTVHWTSEASEDGKTYWTSMEATYTKK